MRLHLFLASLCLTMSLSGCSTLHAPPVEPPALVLPEEAMRPAEPLPLLRTPTPGNPVTGKELSENDLAVVRMYHELAIRHQALIDWVKSLTQPKSNK